MNEVLASLKFREAYEGWDDFLASQEAKFTKELPQEPWQIDEAGIPQ